MPGNIGTSALLAQPLAGTWTLPGRGSGHRRRRGSGLCRRCGEHRIRWDLRECGLRNPRNLWGESEAQDATRPLPGAPLDQLSVPFSQNLVLRPNGNGASYREASFQWFLKLGTNCQTSPIPGFCVLIHGNGLLAGDITEPPAL